MKNYQRRIGCQVISETETCVDYRDEACPIKRTKPKTLNMHKVIKLIDGSKASKCHLTYRCDSEKCVACELKELCKKALKERRFIKEKWAAQKETRRRSGNTIKGWCNLSDPVCEVKCPFNSECDGTNCRLDI